MVLFAVLSLQSAIQAYGRPTPGALVDPDGVVSGIGLPTWDGVRQSLRFPDRVLEVDGYPLPASVSGFRHRSDGWDEAVLRAAREGRSEVSVKVRTGVTRELRSLTLHITPLEPLMWWLYAGLMILTGALYAGAGVLALYVSPRGPLARAFSVFASLGAMFLFSFFDFHTTRALVPLFDTAFCLAPVAALALTLRLPDDVPLLVKRPWLGWVPYGLGASLAAATLGVRYFGGPPGLLLPVRNASFFVGTVSFLVILAVRFLRSAGSRRQILGAIGGAMLLSNGAMVSAMLLTYLSTTASTVVFLALPALALNPLAVVVAFIRHDLWGSRALLSRVLTRGVLAVGGCCVAIALGAAFASSAGVPFRSALLASASGAVLATAVVVAFLALADTGLFSSRARYKPTVEQLSEELTSIASPQEVAAEVERTVRRWLPCEIVLFVPVVDEPDAESSGVRVQHPLLPGVAELVLPVTFRGATIATLRVGEKRGGALFTSEDMDLLRTIVNQAALALAHARAYAELEQRRRQQVAAFRDEREAIVETLAAEVAHEVRYPINFFRAIFRRGSGSGQLDAEEIEIGCEEVDRLERLVSGLKRVVPRRLERRLVPLRELAAKAEMLLRDALGSRRVEVALGREDSIRCDPDQVMQILVNLLSNGLDAAGEGGRVGVRWSSGPGGGELVIWDTGAGFALEPAQLFAPWVTTKPRGTGLGLAITHRFVRAHGWTVDTQRTEGVTKFIVALPLSDIVAPPMTESQAGAA